jgi:Cystathionine beta-lyase family protein involved in aluminum resistance
MAPGLVGEAKKGNHLTAYVFYKLGYRVNPIPLARRRDVIQAIEFGSADKLIAFCRAVQQNSPVGSYLDPVPSPDAGVRESVGDGWGYFY